MGRHIVAQSSRGERVPHVATLESVPVGEISEFERAWMQWHAGYFPVGYMLRLAGKRHWLRFHSLPLSKRYADTDEEREILLARQNELAADVLGVGHPCWLVQTCWEAVEGRREITDPEVMFRACRDYQLSWSFRFVDDMEDGEGAWNVHAAKTTWSAGAFDALLVARADDMAAPTLWMSASTGAIFAPYDGGVDLFLPSREMKRDLKARRADWLPMPGMPGRS
jgi:hypothetical protein